MTEASAQQTNEPIAVELMDRIAIEEAIRDAARYFSATEKGKRLHVIGLATRGIPLAERLTVQLCERGVDAVCGSLDPSFHRDDYRMRGTLKLPSAETDLLDGIDGAGVLLVDDVLHTGRSVRAALSALLDYGRPSYVRLWALIERPGREFPIAADSTGMTLSGRMHGEVRVRMKEIDGIDAVHLEEGKKQ